MKRLFILLAAAFIAGTALAQEAQTMYIIHNNTITHQIPLSEIDSIVFETPVFPPTEVGVVINGIRWATRNVDAPGTFADNPEDAGMFYQWNRRIGWSSTDPMTDSNGNTVWNSSIPAGTAWTQANDPCPAGWRVPTHQELISLRDAGHEWVSNWNDTGINGRLFGTAPNQIFLPAAGDRRSTTGELLLVGSFGSYWTSTRYADYTAQSSWFGSGGVGVGWAWRASGFSVRCVAE